MKVKELREFLETVEPDRDIVIEIGHDGIYQFGYLTTANYGLSWMSDGHSYQKIITLSSTYSTKESQ